MTKLKFICFFSSVLSPFSYLTETNEVYCYFCYSHPTGSSLFSVVVVVVAAAVDVVVATNLPEYFNT